MRERLVRTRPVIVVAGESLVDLIVAEDGTVRAVPGGGPFNTARALGRLGRSVSFLGRISDDRFGTLAMDLLIADGVDPSLVVRTTDPTLLAVAEIDADRGARYRFHTHGTAAPGLRIAEVPPLPAGTTTLHVGTLGIVLEPIGAALEHLVANAAPDILVFCDPNPRPAAITDPDAYRERLDRLLVRVDVVKVSTDDLAWLEPRVGAEDATAVELAARRLLGRGPMVVLLTDGPRPVRVLTREGSRSVAVPSVDVRDTIGGGDAFGAGFLAAWTAAGVGRPDLDDLDAVERATRLATWVGALTITRSGAEPPTIDDLRALDVGW